MSLINRAYLVIFLLLPITASSSTLIELEHYQAKQLVSSGKILPFDLMLKKTQNFCYGKLIDAHLYQEKGKWRYDLHIKVPTGQRVDFSVDASSGRLDSNKRLPKGCKAIP